MYMKNSAPQEARGARKLTALFVSSGIAILAASAMSTSAQAVVVKQESQREIQTLGGQAGDGGVIAGIFASRMRNPALQLISTEGDGFGDENNVDDFLDNDPGNQESNNEQVSQAVDEGPAGIDAQATAVPEPGVLGLFGAGLLGLSLLRRRRG